MQQINPKVFHIGGKFKKIHQIPSSTRKFPPKNIKYKKHQCPKSKLYHLTQPQFPTPFPLSPTPQKQKQKREREREKNPDSSAFAANYHEKLTPKTLKDPHKHMHKLKATMKIDVVYTITRNAVIARIIVHFCSIFEELKHGGVLPLPVTRLVVVITFSLAGRSLPGDLLSLIRHFLTRMRFQSRADMARVRLLV